MFAPDEDGTAANGQHKLWGARLGYAAGPLVVSAAYDETKNDLTGGEDLTDGVIAASYDFGIVRVSGAWRRFKFADSKQNNMLVAAMIPVGAGPGEAVIPEGRCGRHGRRGRCLGQRRVPARPGLRSQPVQAHCALRDLLPHQQQRRRHLRGARRKQRHDRRWDLLRLRGGVAAQLLRWCRETRGNLVHSSFVPPCAWRDVSKGSSEVPGSRTAICGDSSTITPRHVRFAACICEARMTGAGRAGAVSAPSPVCWLRRHSATHDKPGRSAHLESGVNEEPSEDL